MSASAVVAEKPRWIGREYQCSRGHTFVLTEKDERLLDKSMLSTDHGGMSVVCPHDGCGVCVGIPWFDVCSNESLNRAMGEPSLSSKLKDFLKNPNEGWRAAGTWR